MDPYSGKTYPSIDLARADGVEDPVEVSGSPEAIQRLSDAARAYNPAKDRSTSKRQRKAARKARRLNRG